MCAALFWLCTLAILQQRNCLLHVFLSQKDVQAVFVFGGRTVALVPGPEKLTSLQEKELQYKKKKLLDGIINKRAAMHILAKFWCSSLRLKMMEVCGAEFHAPGSYSQATGYVTRGGRKMWCPDFRPIHSYPQRGKARESSSTRTSKSSRGYVGECTSGECPLAVNIFGKYSKILN
jgi:hypothetical protein